MFVPNPIGRNQISSQFFSANGAWWRGDTSEVFVGDIEPYKSHRRISDPVSHSQEEMIEWAGVFGEPGFDEFFPLTLYRGEELPQRFLHEMSSPTKVIVESLTL